MYFHQPFWRQGRAPPAILDLVVLGVNIMEEHSYSSLQALQRPEDNDFSPESLSVLVVCSAKHVISKHWVMSQLS